MRTSIFKRSVVKSVTAQFPGTRTDPQTSKLSPSPASLLFPTDSLKGFARHKQPPPNSNPLPSKRLIRVDKVIALSAVIAGTQEVTSGLETHEVLVSKTLILGPV
jgi:hypothetical protein